MGFKKVSESSYDLVLASSSSRLEQILKQMGVKYGVIANRVNERHFKRRFLLSVCQDLHVKKLYRDF